VPHVAAKAGVKHFMLHATFELAAHGIRANAMRRVSGTAKGL
jgi:NAD(P)-dependent dehydrogenase (short-subunit alcohol dehydrogenase family)